MVLLAIALAACASSAERPPPPTIEASVAPTPPPRPTTPAEPTPTPDPALLTPATADGWRPVQTDPLVAGTQWDQVVWTGDRFLAVGENVMIGSEDGIRWSRVEPEPGARVGAVGMLGERVRVLGAVGGDAHVAWESADSRTWARIARASSVPGQFVAVSDRGWVRVGGEYTDEPCASYCAPTAGVSWASPDGIGWTKAKPQVTLEEVDFGAVVDWDGTWLAAGTRNAAIGIWSSTDGLHWTRVKGATLRPWDRDAMAWAIGFGSLGDTLVLAGFEATQESGSVRLWWSADGRAWNDADVEGLGTEGQLNALWNEDEEILATGWSSACRAWSTRDGRTWQCIASNEPAMEIVPWGIAASPAVQVLVGMADEGSDEDSEQGPPGSIWWRPRP
jgi:hypothetical protein